MDSVIYVSSEATIGNVINIATMLCGQIGSIIGGQGIEDIGVGIENIWELLTLLSYFILPLGLAIAYMRWNSLSLGVPAIIATFLSLPFLQEYGGHYAIPMLILAVGLCLKLLRDAWGQGIEI